MSQEHSKLPSLKRVAGRAKQLARTEGLTLTEAYAQIAAAYGFADWATMKNCIPLNRATDQSNVWHGRNGTEVHIIASEEVDGREFHMPEEK